VNNMAIQTIKVTEQNWKSAVDLIFDLFYDYRLRIMYSRGIEENLPHTEEDATLGHAYSDRYLRFDFDVVVGIHYYGSGYVGQALDFKINNSTIRYEDAGNPTMVINSDDDRKTIEYRISRLGLIPSSDEFKYLGKLRYDVYTSKRID
jgi:hypothetical protein